VARDLPWSRASASAVVRVAEHRIAPATACQKQVSAPAARAVVTAPAGGSRGQQLSRGNHNHFPG